MEEQSQDLLCRHTNALYNGKIKNPTAKNHEELNLLDLQVPLCWWNTGRLCRWE